MPVISEKDSQRIYWIAVENTNSVWAQKEYDILMSGNGNIFSESGFFVMGDIEGALMTEYVTVSTSRTDLPVELAIKFAEMIYPQYYFQLWDQLTDVNSVVLEWRLSFERKVSK